MMGCSWLLIWGLVLNVAHSMETWGSGSDVMLEICPNVTAVLGEDVYLGCTYLGGGQVHTAEWKKLISRSKIKRLTGFVNGKPYNREGFSVPDSPTNLTIRMRVSSVEVEGEYICEFGEEQEFFYDKMFVIVVAQPDVQIMVNAETINDTHYQSVSCSAVGSRPISQISWLIGGLPPPNDLFDVTESKTLHSNGTATLSSVLRFPTHLQDEDSVTCVVQHVTLPKPKLTTVSVETYAKPNVSIKAEMVQQGGNDFWVVSCISSGGRPDSDISLALNMSEELQREKKSESDTQRLSVRLPAADYEGHSITCTFKHPKLSHEESRVITLPTFYLSGGFPHSQMGNRSDNIQATECFELQEGDNDAVISLKVGGNVPRYNVTCKKDEGPLPDDVELLGRNFTVRGLVTRQHAGLYMCDFSYHHLSTTLRFNVTVLPEAPRLVAPMITIDLQSEDGHWVIECRADDAVPAANVSWLLPEGVSQDFWFNSTSHNGSLSVRGVVLLPACSPRELTAQCVINHPAFQEPQSRSLTLPRCARPNITISVSTEWKDGHKYTNVQCSVVSVASAAAISWHAGNNNNINPVTETQVQDEGLVSTTSFVHFLSSLYSGQNLTCTVKHPSLETLEKRSINIPVNKPPLLSMSVVRQQDTPLLLAVCDCEVEGVETNLTWALPANAAGKMSRQTTYEGHIMKTRLTYQFALAAHEGQDLTCVYHLENRIAKKTISIPRYYISAVKVLNHTTPLQSRYSDQPVSYRLSVRENQHNQKILLKVEGNVPEYNLDCRRSDGSLVEMDGDAMILQSEVSGQIKGLYTCQASFYHHTASVNIQLEVTSESEQLILATIVCISSASALLLIVVVIVCVCCVSREGPVRLIWEGQSLGEQQETTTPQEESYISPSIDPHDPPLYSPSSSLDTVSVESHEGVDVILHSEIFLLEIDDEDKTKNKTPYKERESVSALTSLMHEPGSPEVRKPGSEDSEEYAQLTTFSIVIDVKSTV